MVLVVLKKKLRNTSIFEANKIDRANNQINTNTKLRNAVLDLSVSRLISLFLKV